MVARLEALGGEVAAACRRSRARRSRPRRRRASRRRPGWGSPSARRARPPRPRSGRPRRALTSAGELLGARQERRPSRRPAPARSACRAASARPASPRRSAIASRRAVSAASARSTTSSDSPRLACAARTRSGSSRSTLGSIIGALRGCGCMRRVMRSRLSTRRECQHISNAAAGAVAPRPSRHTDARARPPPHSHPGLGRGVRGAVRAAGLPGPPAACPAERSRRPAAARPSTGRRDGPGCTSVLRDIEILFGTIGMTVWTTLIAVPLFVRGHRRAAVFTVGVMISTSLLTTGVKLLYGRDRPTWQDPVAQLASKSFPSGHASSRRRPSAGVLIVLAAMLVRKARPAPRGVRRRRAARARGRPGPGAASGGTTPPT